MCATTRTYRGDHGGAEGVWTAFVPPRHFRPGANEVTVFVIRDEPAGVRLERAYASIARPEMVNLASRGAGRAPESLPVDQWRRDARHPSRSGGRPQIAASGSRDRARRHTAHDRAERLHALQRPH